MNIDAISDLMVRIKNAGYVKAENVKVVNSKYVVAFLHVFKKAGYIKDFQIKDMFIYIDLKYYGKNENHVISNLYRISKPSRRVYMSAQDIKKIINNKSGSCIVTTSQGILFIEKKNNPYGYYIINSSDFVFVKDLNIGGEVIGYVD